ncbi:hypothetical protein FACS1894123_10190 [Bacteroidia bacterium]|nr:hypothetical protein FACS1894123_10190 [Bacteroidia bacterium]
MVTLKTFPFYTQQDKVGCGPSCLRMIAKYYGRTCSLRTLQERSFLTEEGVSMSGICNAAESIGFHTTGMRIGFDRLVSEVKLPCILHWDNMHFVVCYHFAPKPLQKGKNGELDYIIKIADPARGKYTLNKTEFLKHWICDNISEESDEEGMGRVLLLKPSSNFNSNDRQKMIMKSQNEILCRIARYLMLYGSSIGNIGLLNGKMGIALFFYLYARYTGKKMYDDFAGELIDEVYKEIHLDTVCDFKNGLCGIAWGMEYLIRNRFVKADPDDVLEDLDRQIIERDVRRIGDNSLETGLKGIAVYVISRRQNRPKENRYLTREYILDLAETLEKNKSEDEENILLVEILRKITRKEPISGFYNPVFKMTDKIRCSVKSVFEQTRPIGIAKNGYAGIGLHLMTNHKL